MSLKLYTALDCSVDLNSLNTERALYCDCIEMDGGMSKPTAIMFWGICFLFNYNVCFSININSYQ